jgi:hypothetical protein
MNSVIQRRRFIKALGAAAVALPFYDVLLGNKKVFAAGSGRAQRIIFFYWPDGVLPAKWHPTGSEYNFNLAESTSALSKQDYLFLRGVRMVYGDEGSHPGGAKKALTGKKDAAGMSLDRYLAKKVGGIAKFPHLHLGSLATARRDETTSISYDDAHVPIYPEDNPATAYDRVFGGYSGGGGGGGTSGSNKKKSILDGAVSDLNSLSAQLGGAEKSKLDLHLQALRDVESRLQDSIVVGSCSVPSFPGFDGGKVAVDDECPNILKLQMDLMVNAMACGLTKVGTLQLSRHTSEMVMNFAGTQWKRSHEVSHYGDAGSDNAKYFVKQRAWVASQIQYLVDQLKARPEPGGQGSMLDHSIVFCFSEVADGNVHNHDDMPYLLAGGGGGALKPGRIVQYNNEPHTNLLVSLAQAMGDNITRFGDESTGALGRLAG